MEWLNYHHLLYFWVVVREGGLVPASRVLRLAHPTISGQLKLLEESLGEALFDRSGRKLELTEIGRVVYRYADEIFTLGRELQETLKGHPTGRPVRLAVGVTDVMSKLIVRRLLDPAFHLAEKVRVVCREGQQETLLAALALHDLDVVLADSPVPPGSSIKAYNHLLGECGLVFCAERELARTLRPDFPGCLDGAPFLLPTPPSALRRALEQWFEGKGVRPEIVAELDDSALIVALGQDGIGVFAVPAVIEEAVSRQHNVAIIGRTGDVRERFYAISVERKLENPAVVAICESARQDLFV